MASASYFDPAQAKFERIAFLTISDGKVRLANLRSAGADLMRVASLTHTNSLPLANDPRVRDGLELTINREAMNQVVWEGQYTHPEVCLRIAP